MPRGRSPKYIQARRTLIGRLQSAYFAPGARFMSNRAASQEFDLSYPTAQSLLADLAEDGYIVRTRSGTFVPGARKQFRQARVIFDPVSMKEDTFGGAMLQPLKKRLTDASLAFACNWSDQRRAIGSDEYVVLWERGQGRVSREMALFKHRGLLLNATPAPGKAMEQFDSVAIDYFAAGELAGHFLRRPLPASSHVIIVAARPGLMGWAQQCILGFRGSWPRARTLYPTLTDPPSGQRFLEKLTQTPHDAVLFFVVRHALSYFDYIKAHRLPIPQIIVIDKPPHRKDLPFPFVSVSLEQFIDCAVRIVRNRLHGDSSSASHISLGPHIYLPAESH